MLLLTSLSVFAKEVSAPKKAMVIGITGQDGAYLAELLLDKGYEVHGVRRRASLFNTKRIDHIYQNRQVNDRRLVLHYGDVTDLATMMLLMKNIEPDEVYNLAAEGHEQVSFDMPIYSCTVNAMGALNVLEAIRQSGRKDQIRFFQASSNHIFGSTAEIPQNEQTPMQPTSPYGTSKLFAYWITANYRDCYGMYACSGILFNHESPRRNSTFASRKITHGIGRILRKEKAVLDLGNLDAMRDWGYAKDYVEAMWLTLQQDKPADRVIASGESHTVREFVELAFSEAGIKIEWQGSGSQEKGIDALTGKVLVAINPIYYRLNEINCALGDASKAQKELGWKSKTPFNDIVKIMVQSDLSGQNPR
ncbi:MAG: GDP-mannose 4,6-dehydratase [Chlamydiales bacterium]|nr:GDP-mannose 4,6-dehydratase [Chlamydiales bacterium]